MNHVNGFDTTGADLKLVELFAARQLSSNHDLEHPFNRAVDENLQRVPKNLLGGAWRTRPEARLHMPWRNIFLKIGKHLQLDIVESPWCIGMYSNIY